MRKWGVSNYFFLGAFGVDATETFLESRYLGEMLLKGMMYQELLLRYP
jgi:hypothetical protein